MYDDYKNRAIEGIHDYQSKMIDEYMKSYYNLQDVALELPTGTGKTLIGMLIGEFRRRKNNERILYLCPTKQLVYQTVENASSKFGIKALPFVGSKYSFDAKSKGLYNSAEAIAVTTYSGLFNTSPYFTDADILIFDDAHSAENYIASNWSISIFRKEHKTLYDKVLLLVKDFLVEESYIKFISESQFSFDFAWVDKIPNYLLIDSYANLQLCIDSYIESFSKEDEKLITKLKYPWSNIRNNLSSCNIFMNYNEINFRPFIPPTLTHIPFVKAKQRIYMSATLGKSGELERSFGVHKIKPIPMVKDWENKTIGRKFFMFPDLSFEHKQRGEIILSILQITNRAVMLVNDDDTKNSILEFIEKNIQVDTFEAKDIEGSKKPFIKSDNAFLVMSNRFDGIDFPNDECRVLILFDLPTATHLQEKFLITCMASYVLFEERIKTRIVQALGRCTRSHTDYAAVCIMGNELMNMLMAPKKLSQFNPELQAEIKFGKENSVDYNDIGQYLLLLDEFINKRNEWANSGAEEYIIAQRNKTVDSIVKNSQNYAHKMLKEVTYFEIETQYALWQEDYKKALDNILNHITPKLIDDSLKGYKGFWYYMGAFCASNLANSASCNQDYEKIFRTCLDEASKTTKAIKWFKNLKTMKSKSTVVDSLYGASTFMEHTIVRIEKTFIENYETIDKFNEKLENITKKINCNNKDEYESGFVELGKMLGFISVKYSDIKFPACPDPIWTIFDGITIAMEIKLYNNDKDSNPNIPINDIKEAASHDNWVREFLNKPQIRKNAEIVVVFITNRKSVDKSAKIHGKNLCYLNISEFLNWAEKSICALRNARMQFECEGDIVWRENTIKIFESEGITPRDFLDLIKSKKISEM